MADSDQDRGSLSDLAQRDIDALVRHHAQLAEIVGSSLKLQVDVRPERLLAKLSRVSRIPPNEIGLIFQALQNLSYIRDRVKSADKVHAQIAGMLAEPLLSQWNEHEESLIGAMGLYTDDNPLAISFKSRSLAYNFENVLTEAEVLTDARPVFSKDGTEILEYLISHSLAIAFNKNGEVQRVHFALDADDVLKLRMVCERATTKATVLKKALSKNNVPAQVLNDNDGS